MSVDVAVGTPLAEALQGVVLPKLVEVGWSTGLQDDTLSEYIILMLANGKSQEQIASELSNDLLDLGPNDQGAVDFARWLFEQVSALSAQFNPSQPEVPNSHEAVEEIPNGAQSNGDAEMGEAIDASQSSIPTGPKSMRNGSGKTRDKQMLRHLNKNLERGGDAALHRVRGAGGVGRVNSHSREPPKGPRQQAVIRGLAAGNGGMQRMPNMPGMPPIGMQHGAPFQQPQHQHQHQPQQPGIIAMQSQQVQQIMAMMETQAQMMAQLTGQALPGFQGGADQFQQHRHNGRPLSDRVERRGRQDKRPVNPQSRTQQDVPMDGEDQTRQEGEGSDQEKKGAEEIMCSFNQKCTRADCRYAHTGPYSPPNIAVDTTIVCEFGIRCKNKHCAQRHPSPAKKLEEMGKADCKYGPYCTKYGCPFKHPSTAMCRNGADCAEEGCQFWHNPVTCKFPECTNVQCPYKHAEGQKKVGKPGRNKVWVKEGLNGEATEHVSERKFVDEAAPEEKILPGLMDVESEMKVEE